MYSARLLMVLVLLLLATPASSGQDHVVDEVDILSTVTTHDSDSDQLRASLHELLDRPETAAIADANGVDVSQARGAVSTMSDGDLLALAPYLTQLDGSMAGGDKLVISATTVIIILLVLLLVAVA